MTRTTSTHPPFTGKHAMEFSDIADTTNALRDITNVPRSKTRHRPKTVIRRRQLQFLRVFKFTFRQPGRLGTVLLERRDGVDGVDVPLVDREWSIDGRQRQEPQPWHHYEVYTIISEYVEGRHNEALRRLTRDDPLQLTAEIIVARRGPDRRHFVDVTSEERKSAETIAVSVARRISTLERGTAEHIVTDTRYQLTRE
ncbi:hypothetical protein LXA43DRAFT_1067171 [Ganoderma leucocontextum]|nr:hypothetical protein LXA43DRAFT_1067171 [Ganoderma leucocontextum]